MLKKSIILNFALLLFVSLFFTACDKEAVDPTTDVENFEGNVDPDVPHRQRCFKVNFPVTIEFPGGSTATPATPRALHIIMKEWRENNPNAPKRPTFVYPYDVTLQDGSVITVESKEDEKALLEECDMPGKRKRCFHLEFPISFEFPGGSTATFVGPGALKEAMKLWRDNNPNAETYPKPIFPYSVKLRNGEVVTVENQDDQQELRETCGELYRKWKCFKIVFPVSVEFPDGSTAELAGPRALRKLVKEWKENYPDSDQRPHIIFPHDIELQNGDIVTVNNREELKEFMHACNDNFGKKRCYKLLFPATLEFPNGDIVEVSDRDEMHMTLRTWKKDNPDATERPTLAFPYDVQTKDGDIITVTNEDEKAALKEMCD